MAGSSTALPAQVAIEPVTAAKEEKMAKAVKDKPTSQKMRFLSILVRIVMFKIWMLDISGDQIIECLIN